MPKQQVLVIEDDSAIRRGIVDALEFEGYEALEAGSGDVGLEHALRFSYDLLLLDLVLPGTDGFEILQQVKAGRPALPVIILTARGSVSDRVRGLRMGADDYVVKPFSVKELLARTEAVLRRSPERPTRVSRVVLPAGVADLQRREVTFENGECRDLSQREVQLLEYLASNSGRAIARDELLSRIWRVNPKGVETRTVDMHIARLREKLRSDPSEPDVIHTVRGKGYMFMERQSD